MAQFDVFGNSIPTAPKRADLPNTPNITDSKGLKQGEWSKKYDNGNYIYKATFKDDKLVGTMTRYYENGKKSAVLNHRNDGKAEAKLYNESESLIAEGLYIGTSRDSIWRFYDDNQLLKSTEPYNNGVIDGVLTIFYPNGQISEEITYVKGKKHGPWTRYGRGSGKQLIAGYNNDKLHGSYKTYNSNGVCDVDGQYVNGIEDGAWKIYDSEEDSYYTMKYKNGVLLNSKEVDERMAKKMAQYEKQRRLLKDPEQYRNDPDGYMNK